MSRALRRQWPETALFLLNTVTPLTLPLRLICFRKRITWKALLLLNAPNRKTMKELPIIEKLKEELKKVDRELRIEVPKELQKAAAHGDLRENSEYEAAKHRQIFLQARVRHLAIRINSLSSLKLEDIPRGAVAFGSKVYLEDANTGENL